jgi:hypothetical protein
MKAFTLVLILLPMLGISQASIGWVNYPGGVAVATDALNNVYSAYWDYNPGGDITLTKRDSAGSIVWEVSSNNTNDNRHEVATWVETDSQDNILVSGTIRSGYSNPVDANSLLMKYDPSGNLLWRIVYSTEFDGSSTKKCLIDAEDNIYVLGFGYNGTGMSTQVKKFSAQGSEIWSYNDTAGIGKPLNFKFTPDNALIISARAIFGSINGYAKIALDGNPVWSYPGINSLSMGDAAGDLNGNTYLINGEYVSGSQGSVLTKLSADGTEIWQQTNNMAGFRIEVGKDNKAVVSGFPSSGSVGAAFMKYDENGNVLWQNLDADGPTYNFLAHAQMKLDDSDAIYLAASIMTQMAFCKLNSDGNTEWTIVTSGGYANALDFGTNNDLYVTGGTTARIIQDTQITSQTEKIKNGEEMDVFPNPFHSHTNITFTLDDAQPVRIIVADEQGKVIDIIEDKMLFPGSHQYQWNHYASPNGGSANGIYFLRIAKGQENTTRKMILIKQ